MVLENPSSDVEEKKENVPIISINLIWIKISSIKKGNKYIDENKG